METPPPQYSEYPRYTEYPRYQSQPPKGISFDILTDAFNMFGREWKTWTLAALPMLLLTVVWFIYYFMGMMPLMEATETNSTINEADIIWSFSMMFGSMAVYYLGYYVLLAGLVHMGVQQAKGLPISVKDAFTFGGRFFQVVLATIVVSVVTIVGFFLCFIPGILVAIVSVIVFPLITDRKLDAFSAVGESWRMLWPHVGMVFVLQLVANMIAGFSVYVCGVGALFGYSIVALCMALKYTRLYYPQAHFAPSMPQDPYSQPAYHPPYQQPPQPEQTWQEPPADGPNPNP
jgi:hypothetical protein